MSTPAPAAQAVIKKRRPSRLLNWRLHMAERLLRSSRVFLLGLVVICGIEVVVDWNSTLFEINVLRDGMRQRGQNYSRILAKAAVEPMLSYDAEALDRLSDGLFNDEDVVFVRFTDQRGTVMLDRLRDSYAVAFAKHRKLPFREYYASQLRRDVGGILTDPEMLAQRMATSRHRDFVQAWNDLSDMLDARLGGQPQQLARQGGVVLYQDRLKQRTGGHEPDVTYALSTVTDERSEDLGVVLVAFSMERVNAQISKKYLKGLGMVVFFVGLSLIQNIQSRREKLRLLELEKRQQAVKQALRDGLPAGTGDTIVLGGLAVAGGLLQSAGMVDGVAWDILGPEASGSPGEVLLLVIDPDGEGASAVATSLHVLRTFRQRRASGPLHNLLDELAALGGAALTIPMTRPIHIWLMRLELTTGALTGVCSPLGGVRVLPAYVRSKHAAAMQPPLELDESPLCPPEQVPVGIVGPLFSVRGELPPGGLLCGLFTGAWHKSEQRDATAQLLAEHLARTQRGQNDPGGLAATASKWAAGRLDAVHGDVLVLLAARPTTAA